jgi:hypothetical protein
VLLRHWRQERIGGRGRAAAQGETWHAEAVVMAGAMADCYK